MNIRQLCRDEIVSIWKIDRSEIIEHVYYLRDGKLVLQDEYYDQKGWPPGEAQRYTPILLDCFDRGGIFWGAFEVSRMIGVAVLDSRFIGEARDRLQLKFMHISRVYRKRGLGKTLFRMAAEKALELGARKLYISATPSENTVNFYLRQDCTLASEVDPELFALEPEDIHLEYMIPDG